jgi:hypothetical protein
MAFSAFTLSKGVCSLTISKLYLPTCPLLTFDLALLHLLSTTTLALMLVILSTALSPSYYLSMSTDTKHTEDTDVFVMWDLALASPPSSPRLSPVLISGGSYGSILPITPLRTTYGKPSNPYAIDPAPLHSSWIVFALCDCSSGRGPW